MSSTIGRSRLPLLLRLAVIGVFLATASSLIRADDLQDAPQRKQPAGKAMPGVFKAQITPHWFADNKRFWYRNDLRGGTKEFILVDAEAGKRTQAFDHAKLAAALAKADGIEYKPDLLPFDRIDFIDAEQAINFTVGKTAWKCNLSTYECTKTQASPTSRDENEPPVFDFQPEAARLESCWPEGPALAPDENEQPVMLQRQPKQRAQDLSPDGKWTASIKNFNVVVRDGEGKEIALSQDGKEGLSYGNFAWSPDSKILAAFRIEPGDRKDVYLIESSPKGGGRAVLRTRQYDLPGDKFASYQMVLFDVANQKTINPEVDKIDFGTPRLRWNKDGHTFTYSKTDRGHQRFRLIEVDSHTGKARNLIDEQTKTFIWSAHMEGFNFNAVTFLDKSDEILYVSERDGWRHLYLVDAKEGKIKNPITKGPFVVRGVDRVDETNRQIWFRASGKNEGQDPYLIHYYRVDFDGTNLTALTEGDGNHSVSYSPDSKFLIDTYNRVDLAPVNELRRVADGKLVCKLEESDIADLKKTGWEAPEVFVAKGRDGTTDIWGIICRPKNFDSNKKYPVIEYIYAGPQGSFVPKQFSAARRFRPLTDLGFVVVQMDGMGTANRSKAFHDVCWHDLKDAGFPDRILWHQAAAKKYPWYDLSRVGIYGTSAGGQSSTGALLFHGDFYKAAVSACGCHDNRMDKASWNEQWMGYPVGPHYAASSNIENARNLKGKLLLIVGELDTNVPPESTMRLVDALVKAGKDFDLLVMPGLGHSDGDTYGNRRLQDFFVRHLQGIEPPNRNAQRVN
jgi:dipeptidyl aminopeptidase/acylaminoacyl peptidase